jgi:hypothetical protein
MNEYIDKDEAAEKEKIEAQKVRKAEKRVKPIALTQILNGDFLAKDFVLNNLNYVFFFLFMLIMLITKGYYGKQLAKDIDTAQKELDASSAEYVEAKAKLEEETKRSELVEKLSPRGVKETVNPTKVIRIKKED